MILLNIRELFYSYPGEKTTYLLDLPVFDDNDFSIVPDQKIKLVGYKIEDGICLATTKGTFAGVAICTSCLQKFNLEVTPFQTERQFYLKMPEDIDQTTASSINSKTFEVDIEELLREAVFLNLPTNLRCSESCHIEHHETNSATEGQQIQPFKNLRDMIK